MRGAPPPPQARFCPRCCRPPATGEPRGDDDRPRRRPSTCRAIDQDPATGRQRHCGAGGPDGGGISRGHRPGAVRSVAGLGAAALVALTVLVVFDQARACPGRRAWPLPRPPRLRRPRRRVRGRRVSGGAAHDDRRDHDDHNDRSGCSRPAAVGVPAGVDGILYGLTSTGDLLEVDLQDGPARFIGFGEGVRSSAGPSTCWRTACCQPPGRGPRRRLSRPVPPARPDPWRRRGPGRPHRHPRRRAPHHPLQPAARDGSREVPSTSDAT